MEEVITPNTLPDGGDVAPADGQGADQNGNISLEDLQSVLGKEFRDKETALKSVKDTFNYVGDVGKVKNLFAEAKQRLNTDDNGVLEALQKVMDQQPQGEAQPQAPADAFITREQYQEDMFFSKNPNLEETRDLLTALKDSADESYAMTWSDFVKTESAKKVIDTFAGYQEVQAKKSVLESNPRLGAASDKLANAQQKLETALSAQRNGDVTTTNRALNEARSDAVLGVIEAYDLK